MFFIIQYISFKIAARSPAYSLTNQTFQGLTTIRALEAENALCQEFHHCQNANASAFSLLYACFRLVDGFVCCTYQK